MQIAAIHIGENNHIKNFAKEFAKKISNNSNFVTVVDGLLERPMMGGFKYVAFFIDSGKLFSKNYSKELTTFLKEVNIHNASHASLFINDRMFVDKSFLSYMRILEEGGFILHFTEILKDLKELDYILEDFKLPDKFD